MNEKFNINAKVEQFTTMLGIAVRLIVIDPFLTVNVVIFAGGKFRKNVGKTFHVWGYFSQYFTHFLNKVL